MHDGDLDIAIAKVRATNPVLYETVGLFLAVFCAADHQISRVLAHITGYISVANNFEIFDRDFGSKTLSQRIELLRIEGQKNNKPMGPAIKQRIKIFDTVRKKIRNPISHSELAMKGTRLACSSIGAHVQGAHFTVRPRGLEPIYIELDDVKRTTLWLVDFTGDLAKCAVQTWGGDVFDISAPASNVHLLSQLTL